jgi:redox-sensitive bicupin YhaK (pirin superfamily)
VLLRPREVPLGGPRAMTVRRTLPQLARTFIGAWCFVDHYGPDDVSETGGMAVPGHPHTGLATATWLFAGEVEHRDTSGTHAIVRPGELNLMTAGSGIAHSEFSTPGTDVLHGVQLWIALPERDRFVDPGFVHHVAESADIDGAQVAVFLGDLLGITSPVATHSPLVGAEITVPAGQRLRLPVDVAHEHGLLCDSGQIRVGEVAAGPGELVLCPTGARTLDVVAGPDAPARLLLIGGEPLGEKLVMWWNFIGGSDEEVRAFRAEWERERQHGGGRRFGRFPQAWTGTLPAPEVPNVTLRLRG